MTDFRSKVHQIRIALSSSGEMPDTQQLVDGIRESLADEWFAPFDGDDYYISYMGPQTEATDLLPQARIIEVQGERIRELTRENESLANLQERYDASLQDWVAMRDLRDDAIANLVARLETVNLLKEQRNELRQLLLESKAEVRVGEEMVAKIVDAMQSAGYDISGFGSESDFTELEAINTELSDSSIKFGAKLDEIRTGR